MSILQIVLSNKDSVKAVSFINVLQNPTNVVPALADEEIYTIVVDSMRAYLEEDIDLKTFVDIVMKIKLFSGIKENVNEDINSALLVLSDLTKHLEKKSSNREEINTILIEALDLLSKKKTK